MRTYEYRGFETSGKSSSGLIEAIDLKDARERLVKQGILPERVVPAGAKKKALFSFSRQKPFHVEARARTSTVSLVLLSEQGYLSPTLWRFLISTPEMGKDRSILANLRNKLREGASMADALQQSSRRTMPFEHAVIEVGEKVGRLEDVLELLAGYLTNNGRFKTRYKQLVFILLSSSHLL